MGNAAVDNTLASFLEVLLRLRRIILQDAACLSLKHPGCALFSKYAPFNTVQFATFATSAAATIEHTEQEARHQLSHLPEHIASSFQGAMTTNNIQQEQLRLEVQQQYAGVTSQLEAMGSLLHAVLLNSHSCQRKQLTSAGNSYHHHCTCLLTFSLQSGILIWLLKRSLQNLGLPLMQELHYRRLQRLPPVPLCNCCNS